MLCELSNVGMWGAIGIACDGSLIEKSRLSEHCAREGKPDPFLVVVDPANPGKKIYEPSVDVLQTVFLQRIT